VVQDDEKTLEPTTTVAGLCCAAAGTYTGVAALKPLEVTYRVSVSSAKHFSKLTNISDKCPSLQIHLTWGCRQQWSQFEFPRAVAATSWSMNVTSIVASSALELRWKLW
jgi:hypothetical protein